MSSGHYGLKPTLKNFKGSGFGRVLPAPFEFFNGWKGDGTNDEMIIDELTGQSYSSLFGSDFTIECWIKPIVLNNRRFLRVAFNNGGRLELYPTTFTNMYNYLAVAGTFNQDLLSGDGVFSEVSDNYYVLTRRGNTLLMYSNANLINSKSVVSQSVNPIVSAFNISFASSPFNTKINEFRFYKRGLSIDEIILNYNNGLGANPADVENLEIWYDFNRAELGSELYDVLPTGWAGSTYGIRNMVAKQDNPRYHLRPINQINNATLGGTIQAW